MIRQLHVRNFKSLRDVRLSLGTRNVLVGPNMSGKSNILSVFHFLARLARPSPGISGLAGALNAVEGFTALAWQGSKGDDANLVSIELEGDLGGIHEAEPETTWTYRIDILGNRRQPGGPVTVQDERLCLSASDTDVILIERDPHTGHRLLRDRRGNLLSEVADAQRSALEFEIPSWDGVKIRTLFAASRFYRLIPETMRDSSSAAAAHVLEANGHNLAAWLLTILTRYPAAFDKLQRTATSALPELTRIYPFPTPQAQVFVASSERSLRSDVPASQMSDGELCFIALLSLVFAPKELGSPLHCIEEPENHLHPRLLETLVEVLRQEQQAAGSSASQVLVTTHSPQLVDRISVDDLIIVGKQEAATVCRRPEDKQHVRELLEDIGLGELYYSGALGGA